MTTEMWLNSGELIQFIGGLFMIATYIPQILMLFKTKSAENQSMSFWIMLVISLSSFTYNALLLYLFKGVFTVLVTQAFNLALAMFVLVQLIVYSRRKRK